MCVVANIPRVMMAVGKPRSWTQGFIGQRLNILEGQCCLGEAARDRCNRVTKQWIQMAKAKTKIWAMDSSRPCSQSSGVRMDRNGGVQSYESMNTGLSPRVYNVLLPFCSFQIFQCNCCRDDLMCYVVAFYGQEILHNWRVPILGRTVSVNLGRHGKTISALGRQLEVESRCSAAGTALGGMVHFEKLQGWVS